MSVEISSQIKSGSDNPGRDYPRRDYLGQPVVYGVLPDQLNDEISLADLFSKLASQWKLIITATVGGTLLAAVLALLLPTAYQPSLKVSVPLAGNIADLVMVNTLLGGNNDLPTSQQAVFTSYYNMLRSGNVFAEYIYESNYLEKHYPDATEDKPALLASMIKGLKINIEEPKPERKGGYVANPSRLAVSLEVENEAAGIELLNNFVIYANQRLVNNLQNNAHTIIRHKIEILTKQMAKLREQYRHDRVLAINKMELGNDKKIAQLQEQLSAYVVKAKANRTTRIANAGEALKMAKSLDIIYPTTLDAMAQRGQEGRNVSTAITVVDKQASSLYLQGTKYLSALIETLENRKSDAQYLKEVNNLKERIQLIKNDQTLVALKKRQSDDPWIKGLPAKLAEMDALKALSPDFTDVVAFTLDGSAVITNKKIKPNRKLIVAVGFILSLFIALFVAMIVASLKDRNMATENAGD